MKRQKKKSLKEVEKKLNEHMVNISKLCHIPSCKSLGYYPFSCCREESLDVAVMWEVHTLTLDIFTSFSNLFLEEMNLIRFMRAFRLLRALINEDTKKFFNKKEYSQLNQCLIYLDSLLVYMNTRMIGNIHRTEEIFDK